MPGSAGRQFAGSLATAPNTGGVKSPTAAPASNGAAAAASAPSASASSAIPSGISLRNKDTLPGEERVVGSGCGLAVRAAVEDVDLVQLPDRPLALHHRSRHDRVEGRRERARASDRRVGG